MSAPAARRPLSPFDSFVRRYYADRVAFVQNVLGITPQPWQVEILQALDQGETRIAVRSGHGVGKTALLAWSMVHFLLTRHPCKIAATAASSPQLFDALASECKRWIRKMEERQPALKGLLVVLSDRIDLGVAPESAFITFRTSRIETPESLAGIHSPNVLLIADEASGIPNTVFEAAGGSLSTPGSICMLTGNPTRNSGFFFDVHTKLSDVWRCWRVGCDVSSLVSRDYILDVAKIYGEASNAYRVRVLGEFPLHEEDTLIARGLVEESIGRDVALAPLNAPMLWGLDCARFGDALSGLAKRRGNHLVEPVRVFRGLDTMQLVGAIKAEYDGAMGEMRPQDIAVDAIGLGAGVADRLRELGLPALAVNVSEAPSFSNANAQRLRDELWLNARDWFGSRQVRRPPDEALVQELTTPRVSYMSTGKLKVEGKEEMRRRGVSSPDRADAFCLTFAAPAGMGSGMTRRSWGQPIRRGIKVV